MVNVFAEVHLAKNSSVSIDETIYPNTMFINVKTK